MLLELKVTNFAIIDNAHIQFRAGLNILSGETGAGKSIILKSLALMMGEKADTEAVRTGSEQAIIEGSFDLTARPDIQIRLQELGIEASDSVLVVRRIVSSQSKARIYLNGSLATLAALREVVSPLVEVTGQAVPLIEMTGQADNRHLTSKAYHLDLLDQYSGVSKDRIIFSEKYHLRSQLKAEIEQLNQQEMQRAQRLDFLRYQRDEIIALDLKPGEEVEIESQTRRLKSASKLIEFSAKAEEMLFGEEDSVDSRLATLLQKAGDFRMIDPKLSQVLDPLSQARALIEDVSIELRNHMESLESDPNQLSILENRLSELRKLQKKYGATASEILKTLENIENEIDSLENHEERLQEKSQELSKLEGALLKKANEMHAKREGASVLLAKSVNAELNDLNMKGVIFLVALEKTAELGPFGLSSAEFMTQASKKDAPRPLAKFASGGELSRILLSLKRSMGAAGMPRTYLFDEVDAGVSGPTAEKVGRKLKSIARGQQVICVTHLPQVAAFGDAHFYIHKSNTRGAVQTEVSELKQADRIGEIARLISGEKITKSSLTHASELLKTSQLREASK